MPPIHEIEIHPVLTTTNQQQYQFTPKHHGADLEAACWLIMLTREEEFLVFNNADMFDICDDDGNHYGVGRDEVGYLRILGTWNQQVASFPFAREGEPWHGYPLYPVSGDAPDNRRGQRMRPAKIVFEKLQRAALIGKRERKRLMQGKHA